MIDTECTTANLGDLENSVRETLAALQKQNLPERLWAKDPSLWKNDPAVREKISNRLGWLNLTETLPGLIPPLQSFAGDIKTAGFQDVFLLGMGGSSLCPEVLKRTFSPAPGRPRLSVLDTTDPEAIRNAESACDLTRTLFILASKSGSTIEMRSLYRYFSEKVRAISGEAFGKQFIAITDPGSPLEKIATENGFRKIFSTPADVGGRYSALTAFGLVPAALLGLDLGAFLKNAEAMRVSCAAAVPCASNPGVLLGAIMACLAQAGRDKLTFVSSASLSHFGIWAEQLIAESTGKEGKGIVPVDREMPGDAGRYGGDRLFIYLRLETDDCAARDEKITALQKAGQPVVRIELSHPNGLAGEFLRWEIATAVAGVVLAVNPFDEPNVSESKENTAAVLAQFEKTGTLTLPPAKAFGNGISLSGNLKSETAQSLEETLQSFLAGAQANSYVAIMAYLAPSEKHDALLQQFRIKIRNKYRVATTVGYGPRFLHSTGQLHKGGKRNGLFIQITVEEKKDLGIPGAPYSFGILKRAQALGDFHSLVRRRLPVLEIRLGKNFETGLKKLLHAL